MTIACVAGGSNVDFQVKRIPSGGSIANFGSAQTLTAGNTYQNFSLSLAGSAGDTLLIAVTSAVGGTPPTNVTVTLTWEV
jgi:hypothetical protein